ncbi:Erg28 [Niveomyces insectorum RCEF 264]|uniref:Erg28 n=1 Tax=Niveomyces insectorum RCEF 264 TaxID=1081102 RepID=A0A167YMW4_9HYPO|nr:Erg28 [Niveomyces insectorum RCEF 264]
MDKVLSFLPPGDLGLLPYYLFFVGTVAVGNAIQNLATLHYTRRLYNGVFVPNPSLLRPASASNPNLEDRTDKLVPASSTGKDVEKARDQVTPLAARLFGVYTLLAGVIRVYAAYDVGNRALYQLSLITHLLAAVHFTSELFLFKTMRLTGPQVFPLAAGFVGATWMTLQYSHYVLN